MARLTINYYSDTLDMETTMMVFYPQSSHKIHPSKRKNMHPPFQVLYLLHGSTDNYTGWGHYTAVERLVQTTPLLVVMPEMHKGFYLNQAIGPRYSDFLTQELPQLIQEMFPVSPLREDTFIAGLSMGGFGAFHAALTYPEQYSYAASLSGLYDIESKYQGILNQDHPYLNEWLFGGMNPKGTDKDLYYLADQLLESPKPRPHFYMSCGQSDFLYPQHVAFLAQYEESLAITHHEGMGGHTWEYWDEYVIDMLAWLPLRNPIRAPKRRQRG